MPIWNTLSTNAKNYNNWSLYWRESVCVSGILQTNPRISHQPADITLTIFLEEVRLTEEDYIIAVQTSFKTETIFLERRPIAISINPYMKGLLDVWKANYDIQFVSNAYICATHIVSYSNKSASGMSHLMAETCKEAQKGNKSLKDPLPHIGNKFLNSTEVSAHEEAYLILQLSMSTKSRKYEFLSTAPRNERTLLLKSQKELEALPMESTEIEADNAFKRYARRNESLEDYCLLILSQRSFL